MNPQELERGVAELMRQFGHGHGAAGLDRDVLASVLEMHGGNVQQTVAFLQAGEGQMVDPGPAHNGLPPGYMQKPNNWVAPKPFEGDVDPASHEGACLALKTQLMSSETPFLQLFDLATKDFETFLALLLLLVEQGVDLAGPAKAKILAVVLAKKEYETAEYLLARNNYMFGLPEVLRAVKLLDMPRKIKQFNKKIQRMEENGHASAKTLRSIRARLTELARDYAEAQVTTVNGSMVKRLRKWVRTIPAEHLQFFALQMPKEPWKELADICHFAPSDFKLPWFLPFCFGAEPPADSLLKAGALTGANVQDMVKRFHVPYSYLRKQLQNLSNEVKGLVASFEKLSIVIWYYEELECGETDAVLSQRLAGGEDPELPYGKLMERILFMKMNNKPFYALLLPIAERRLKSIRLPLERPVVVFGDASYSMDVAVRVSTIVASLLTVLADADIFFFNVASFAPPQLPSSIAGVLDVALNTKADGLTAPACTLREFYDKKKPVKFFIVVTDEIENEQSNGTFFAQLFYKYYMEVHPARLVMVSFLDDPNVKGRMVRALEDFGIVPLQFRLDSKRPDLSKLDSLLGLLSAETNFFSVQAKTLAEARRAGSSVATLVHTIREGPEALKKSRGNNNNNNEASAEDAAAPKPSAVQQYRLKQSQDGQIPADYMCPIAQELMEDPVVASDGNTYERAAITAWFQLHLTSPITNLPLETKMLFPNLALRSAILDYVEKRSGGK